MTASEAKEFVISRIVAEAHSLAVPLSETESQMLYWSEIHPPPNIPNLKDLAERFDAECDSDEYEAKIRRLAEAARQRDSVDAAQAQQWKDALDALSKKDHYINVMLPGFGSGAAARGGQNRVRDIILYLAIAITIVIALVIYVVYTSH